MPAASSPLPPESGADSARGPKAKASFAHDPTSGARPVPAPAPAAASASSRRRRPEPPASEPDDATLQARARALASPLRMRVLRLCLHEARTNRELAEELGINPGTLLHHVRSLVNTGFLVAEETRRGTRGAREVPYRATRLSWRSHVLGIGPVLLETFLQEIEGLPPEDVSITRLGLKLNAASRDELIARFDELFQEYAAREADADGEPISLLFAEHPDLPKRERATRR